MAWAWAWLGVMAGAVVAAAGLFVMRYSRTRGSFQDSPEGEADGCRAGLLGWLLGRTSVPTRLSLGLCLMVLGYHLASYALPTGWLWLRVPPGRLWILGVVVVVLVGGSLILDRVEERV
ncbi:MAG: hypothetical protein Kow0022_08330 [Phycisphaerales bacterium]